MERRASPPVQSSEAPSALDLAKAKAPHRNGAFIELSRRNTGHACQAIWCYAAL